MADSPAKTNFLLSFFFVLSINFFFFFLSSAQKPFSLIASKNISYAGTVSASNNVEQV